MSFKQLLLLFLCITLANFSTEAQYKDIYSQHTGCKEPSVDVFLKKGQTVYKSIPTFELEKMCQSHFGCAQSEYNLPYRIYLNKKGCKQLDFTFYAMPSYVYISDKYSEDSCEYEMIKEHEDSHVFATENFSEQEIKKYLLDCINMQINEKKLKTGEEIYSVCAEKVKLRIQKTIEDRNKKVDIQNGDFSLEACQDLKEIKENVKKRVFQ